MRMLVVVGLIGTVMFWHVSTSLGASAPQLCWYGAIQAFLNCSNVPHTSGDSLSRENGNTSGDPDPSDTPGTSDGGTKGGKDNGDKDKDHGDKDHGDKHHGDKDKGDKGKGDKDKGGKDKGGKDKGDKDKGDEDDGHR